MREIRIERGLSQRAAAEKAGLTPVYLCYLEHDRNEPTIRVMRRLARVYGTKVSFFIDE